MAITVHYPGRACLLGEHCDWAGGASLTVPLEQGIQVCAEPAQRDLAVATTLEGRVLEGHWDLCGKVDPEGGPLRFVPAAVAALRSRRIVVPPVQLRVTSDLPPGRGLSSSAAFCVAILDALTQHAGCSLERNELASLATHVERDLLGVACGPLDPLACVAEEPILLRWGLQGSVAIEPIHPALELHLVVGSFAAPRDTPTILRVLQEHALNERRAAHDPQAVAAVREALAIFAIEAEQGAAALRCGDPAALGLAMNRCQHAYDQMATEVPVLHAPALRQAVLGLRQGKALGAKFSGAGGDGSVIALYAAPDDARRAQEWLSHQGGCCAWTCTIQHSQPPPRLIRTLASSLSPNTPADV